MTHSLRAMLKAGLEVPTEDLNETQEATLSEDIVVADELVEAEAELRMTEEAIDVAEETVESLDEIVAKMEEVAEEGGLSEESAEMLRMALNMTLKPFGGLEAVMPAMPGTEAFGDAGQRGAALQAGIEAAKEAKEGVVAAIWKWIKEQWNKLTTWFKSIFTAVGRLKKGSAALAAATLEGTASEAEVEIGKKAAKLMIGGKVSETALAADLKVLVNQAKAVTNPNTYLSATKSGYAKLMDELAKDPETDVSEAIANFKKENQKNVVTHFGLDNDGLGKEMLGQVQWKGTEGVVALVAVKDAKEAKDTKLKALDAAGIKKLAKEISDLAVALEGADKAKDAYKKFAEDLAKMHDDLAAKLKTKDVGLLKRGGVKVLLFMARRSITKAHAPSTALVSHGFSVLSAAYAYAVASRKNLKTA